MDSWYLGEAENAPEVGQAEGTISAGFNLNSIKVASN